MSDSTSSPSRQDVLAGLDADIQRTAADRDAGGWTQAALLGALGASAWLLLSTWESESFHPRGAALFFAMAWLFHDAVVFPLGGMSFAKSEPDAASRFTYPDALRADLPNGLAQSALSAALAYVLSQQRQADESWWILGPAIVLYSFRAVSAVLGAIYVSFSFPVPEKASDTSVGLQRFLNLFAWLNVAIPLATIIALISRTTVATPGQKVTEFKVGILAASVVFITIAVARRHHFLSPQLTALHQLRRRFLLGASTAGETMLEWEAVRSGVPASEILRTDLLRIVASINALRVTAIEVEQAWSGLRAQQTAYEAQSARVRRLSDLDPGVSNALALADSAVRRATRQADGLRRAFAQAARRAQLAATFVPASRAIVTRPLVEVKLRIDQLLEAVEPRVTQLKNLRENIEAPIRAAHFADLQKYRR
jgi:hypothetical protein